MQTQFDTLEVAVLRIRNPAFTFEYDLVPAAITADRQLNMPLITGTDTLVALALAQTLTNKTLTSPVLNNPSGTLTANAVFEVEGGSGKNLTVRHAGLSVSEFKNSRSRGTIAAPTATQSADILGQYGFSGYGTAWEWQGPHMKGRATEIWSATAMGSKLEWATIDNTTTTEDLRMSLDQDGGLFMAGATGSSKGVGTINAVGVYDDGVLLTCYVAEEAAKGPIKVAEWDALVPPIVYPEARDSRTGALLEPERTVIRLHDPARAFTLRAGHELDPKQFYATMLATGHLPAMPSKAEWIAQGGKYSIGDLLQRLWETVEVQTVHIGKLEARLTAGLL